MPKTGQVTFWANGGDGDLQKGIIWPVPRFSDNGDGTITDNLTGLIWLKNANCFGQRSWYDALSDCDGLSAGWCGLTDGSSIGDWRLPNRFELESLLDIENSHPTLPYAHPFQTVQSDYYWSSSTFVFSILYAWNVYLAYGYVEVSGKTDNFYVWPVRGGH